MPAAPTLLISWSHSEPDWADNPERQRLERERRDSVLRLAHNLRISGIDAALDRHQPGGSVDWTRWGPDKVETSDFVLIVGSPAWNLAWRGNGDPTRGAGAAAEADALRTVYSNNRETFLAKVRLVFLPGTPTERPLGMDGVERYDLTDETPAALAELLRDLSGQPAFPPTPLGQLPDLPPDDSWRHGATPAAAEPTAPSGDAGSGTELAYLNLDAPVSVTWRDEWSLRESSSETVITVHVVPFPSQQIPSRRMTALSTSLAGQVRATGLFNDTDGLSMHDGADGITVTASRDERYLRQLRPARLLGLRVDRSGQVSAWHSLPADTMGSAIDGPSAAAAVTACLRLAGAAGTFERGNVALAVEIGPTTMLDATDVGSLGHRNTAGMPFAFGPNFRRIEPDELVEVRALSSGAEEVGQSLSQSILRALSQQR